MFPSKHLSINLNINCKDTENICKSIIDKNPDIIYLQNVHINILDIIFICFEKYITSEHMLDTIYKNNYGNIIFIKYEYTKDKKIYMGCIEYEKTFTNKTICYILIDNYIFICTQLENNLNNGENDIIKKQQLFQLYNFLDNYDIALVSLNSDYNDKLPYLPHEVRDITLNNIVNNKGCFDRILSKGLNNVKNCDYSNYNMLIIDF